MKNRMYGASLSMFLAGVYFMLGFLLQMAPYGIMHAIAYPFLAVSAWFIRLMLLEIFPEKEMEVR